MKDCKKTKTEGRTTKDWRMD